MLNNIDVAGYGTDGTRDTRVLLGEVISGDFGDLEIATEQMMGGNALPTGVTGAFTFRVLFSGPVPAWVATLQGRLAAGTNTWIHLDNRAGDIETVHGPAKLTACYVRGGTAESGNQSVIIAYNVAGDYPDNVLVVRDIE